MGNLNCILCTESILFYYLLIILQMVLKVWYLFYWVLMAFKMILSRSLWSQINMLLKILVIHVQILNFISEDLSAHFVQFLSWYQRILQFRMFHEVIGLEDSRTIFHLIVCIIIIPLCIIFIKLHVNAPSIH